MKEKCWSQERNRFWWNFPGWFVAAHYWNSTETLHWTPFSLVTHLKIFRYLRTKGYSQWYSKGEVQKIILWISEIPMPHIGYTVLKPWQYCRLARLKVIVHQYRMWWWYFGVREAIQILQDGTVSSDYKGSYRHFSEIQTAPIDSAATKIWAN